MLRECLEREIVTVETPVGTIRFKVARRDGQMLNAAPEFDDCVRAAATRGCRSRTCRRWRSTGLDWIEKSSGHEPRFYLTTAIDYVNSRPHLGTAYEKIAADVIARYKRLAGFETHFVMGNDEHSQNVFRKARELGEDPLAYCDRMAAEFLEVWRRLDISFDDFIRTTEPRHKTGVQELVRRMTAAGRHLRRTLRRVVLRLLRGLQAGEGSRRRPVSDSPDQAGLDPREELLLPSVEVPANRSPTLSRSTRTSLVPDIRRNEILRLIEGGLEDISVSRAGQAWGIPMPDDPSSVIYVWVDALINYITAVGYGTDRRCSNAGGRRIFT